MIGAERLLPDGYRATGERFARREPAAGVLEESEVMKDGGGLWMMDADRLLDNRQSHVVQVGCFVVPADVPVQNAEIVQDRGNLRGLGTKGPAGNGPRLLERRLRLAITAGGQHDARDTAQGLNTEGVNVKPL